ncbi:hypothetical protein JTB14_012694 [Gonioctena quinquepunctata]|nr:hypothetical protein JTB14_012694 [Gonioctena quinquepunctata]
MSQIPRNRFGFQGPRTVTATATRTTRVPGTNTTTTESRNAVTEITPCPEPPPGPQAQAPQRGIPRPTFGLRPPISSQPPPPPRQFSELPGPSQQAQRGIRPPGQGIPQLRISRPSGIPKTPALRAPPTRQPTSTSIRRKSVDVTPMPSKQLLDVPLASTPDRKTPSPESLAPKIGRMRPIGPRRPIGRPFGIGVHVPKSLTMDPHLFRRKSPIDRVSPMEEEVSEPMATMEEQVNQQLLEKSFQQPGKKVSAKGKRVTTAEPEVILTPAGSERVLQKAVFERRVERRREGEKIVKNLALTDFDESTGTASNVEVGLQQLDPQTAMAEGREVLAITSTMSVTPSYTMVDKKIIHSVTEPLDRGVSMEPAALAKLVEEEKEDVENTLKMIPPDLNLGAGKYETKKRLQKLRLHSESMALLEASIVRPITTADDVMADPLPEMMANMMHTVENGISPRAAPDQVFHTLFTETANEQFITMSSVSPGPLQDVVIPTDTIPNDIHQEVISDMMDKLTDKFSRIGEPEHQPYVDIFSTYMDKAKKTPTKGRNKPISFPAITDEKSLWVNAKLEHLVYVVGAEPADVLLPIDIEELDKSEDMEKEMMPGIEFYLDTDAIQYLNRIQLRGSQFPSFFPGYMVAVPDFPGIVQIARTPDEVFATAWNSVQPKYFAESCLDSTSF